MATYSFLSVQAAIVGAGGAFPLGSGSGASEEGITTSMIEEKDVPSFGADGTIQHVLRAPNGGKMTVRMLKTSNANAMLTAMYNFQRLVPSAWGLNVITITDVNRGDVAVLSQAAFVKLPDVTWDKDGKTIEWEFVGILNEQLGAGVPNINI